MPKHEIKKCQHCHKEFKCKVDSVLLCQCQSVQLTQKQSAYIERKYDECLCIYCLKKIKEKTTNERIY